MPIVPAKCTCCGATLEVDDKNEAAVCQSCGTAFIVEKAINYYNTSIHNTYNNNFAGATINITNSIDADNMYSLGVDSYNGGRFQEAYDYFTKTLEVNVDHALAIIRRGLSMARLSVVTQTSYNINFSLAISGFLRVFHNDSMRKTISDYQINSLASEMTDSLYTVICTANDCYVPRSLNTDNINIVLGALGTCLDACIEFGNAFSSISGSTLETQALFDETLYKIGICTLHAIDSMIMEREYSVAWGLRSGIGQINKVKPNNYDQLLQLRHQLESTLKETYPDKDIPDNTGINSRQNNQIQNNYGCYIATCVYGSYNCPEVWVLRRYRDYKLAKTKSGRLFIKIYYAISPKLVKWFGRTKWFKAMWRGKLNRMVKKYKSQGFEDTPYDDPHY